MDSRLDAPLPASGTPGGGSVARRAAVAVLNVGLARTVAHPAIASSFDLMRSSLLRDGHDVKTFLYLSGLGAPKSSHWGALLRKYYRPSAMWLRHGDDLGCNTLCTDVVCDNGTMRNVPAASCGTWFAWPCTATGFVQQFHRLSLAWALLSEWEAGHSWRYDWVVKLRPDILWLEPFPSLARYASPGDVTTGDAVFVPYGVMTDSQKMVYQHVNDHVLLCPRRLCRPYFVDVVKRYQKCGRGGFMRLPYPPQLLVFNRTCPRGIRCELETRFLDASYTLSRQHGLDCARLICAGRAEKFLPRCQGGQTHWADPARARDWFESHVKIQYEVPRARAWNLSAAGVRS